MDYFYVKNRTLVWVLLRFQITMNMQVIKCELLSHSLDPNIVALYKTREAQNAKLKCFWKATNTVKEAHAEVNID